MNTIEHIQKIVQQIEVLRAEIVNHRVYEAIENIEDLRVFMKYHVFAKSVATETYMCFGAVVSYC